uniref:Uncharacterized protein n=1 Tax=Rangifer tarandus platyrhynchus TaxID=3082113 RepID=A0ACB0FA67_RANTA|nr:unnamed protein product [Rangifer tarandus platyrhynchus]
MCLAETSRDSWEQRRKARAMSITHTKGGTMVPSGQLCKNHWQPLMLKTSTDSTTAADPQRGRQCVHLPEGATVTLPQAHAKVPPLLPHMPPTVEFQGLRMEPHFKPKLYKQATCIHISGARATAALC